MPTLMPLTTAQVSIILGGSFIDAPSAAKNSSSYRSSVNIFSFHLMFLQEFSAAHTATMLLTRLFVIAST